MNETIDFMNDAVSKPASLVWEYGDLRGVWEISGQSYSINAPCVLTYGYHMQLSPDRESLKRGAGHFLIQSIQLESADPLSIQVTLDRGYQETESTPNVFDVSIKKPATQDERAVDITIGYLSDKTTAERVAKALIHAVVLCHTSQPPSPF